MTSSPIAAGEARRPVRRALLSVSDKSGLVELTADLHSAGVVLVSTGSTAARIAEGGVPVTPVLMGYQTPGTIAAAARAIRKAVESSGRRVLLIASSDLSHYEPRSVASRLDGRVVDRLEAFDVDGLSGVLASNHNHACGGGPMVAILSVARALGATGSRILAYGDSGDVNGDTDGVVGYVSAAFYRSPS